MVLHWGTIIYSQINGALMSHYSKYGFVTQDHLQTLL